MTVIARLALCCLFIATACGGAGAGAPAPSALPSASPRSSASAAPTSTPVAQGAARFDVASRSKVTVRVREQLARLQSPTDAVLTTSAVSGAFDLMPDGTFAPTSKIVVDLSTLQSDARNRDQFIKENVLETAKFKNAELTPKRAMGLALPLPAAGDLAFKLVGDLTIRGVTKEVTLDVTAKRAAKDLTATTAIKTSFTDFGMKPPSAEVIPFLRSVVLTVVDEIRLEIELVAEQRG